MPGSTLIHAVVFTAGALVGGGIAAAVSSRKNQQQPALPEPHQPAPLTEHHSSHHSSLVLKYGHPGEFGIAARKHMVMAYRPYIGPDTQTGVCGCI